MSDRPIVAKSPSATRPRDTNVFSPTGSINDAVAVDPIENVGVPSSFYDFEPDRDVVDNDRMPGEPSSPCGSIFWLYSHLIIPSFWFEDNRAEAAPCLGRRKSIMSWTSLSSTSRSQAVSMHDLRLQGSVATQCRHHRKLRIMHTP
jgi:hypothetical protein